jgi:hypothetical protein
MTNIKSIRFFSNGNVAVFDEIGQQIPELQANIFEMFCERAERLGYDVTTAQVKADIPCCPYDGALIKTDDGEYIYR